MIRALSPSNLITLITCLEHTDPTLLPYRGTYMVARAAALIGPTPMLSGLFDKKPQLATSK